MNRREARDAVFGLIFESSFYKGTETELHHQYTLSVDAREINANEYIHNVYHGVVSSLSELDSLITKNAVGWKIDRMSKVTLAILRLCIYEMFYVKDAPYNVAINEAVELAKKYDHDQAPAFINGIANKIAEDGGLKNKS